MSYLLDTNILLRSAVPEQREFDERKVEKEKAEK